MTTTVPTVGDLVMQIEGEFLETPHLRLTSIDAQQRFGLDQRTCSAILETLADANVLEKRNDGAYVRFFPRTIGHFSSAAPFVSHAA